MIYEMQSCPGFDRGLDGAIPAQCVVRTSRIAIPPCVCVCVCCAPASPGRRKRPGYNMGIDLRAGGRSKRKQRDAPRSQDPYLQLLVRLYAFLARRTGAPFNAVVWKRLCMSRTNRPPISLSRLLRYYDDSKRKEGRIAVVIGKVLDDERKLRVPPNIRLCALQISDTARARIEAAGGQVMTLDQLALVAPRGENTILIRGRLHQRRCYKHFVGVTGREHVRPYTLSKGRKFERARGRRKSRGFKV